MVAYLRVKMVEVINITKKFDDFTAIEDISFSVPDGSIYGLIGYNGAGKTTLLKTVAGVYKAEDGVVLLNGSSVFDNSYEKQRLFYVPDEIFFENYSTMEKMAKFYNGFYPKFNYNIFYKLSEVFNLDVKKRINSFSKGMQRQAEIVLGISTTPKYLLFDESFDGLDPAKRALIKGLLFEYVKINNASVIISSHDLHELEGICDYFGLIDGKRLKLNMDIGEMINNRRKVRAIFNNIITKSDIENAGISIKSFYPEGKIVLFTSSDEKYSITSNLKKLNPVSIDFETPNLEDIFMDEAEGAKYDFSKIV